MANPPNDALGLAIPFFDEEDSCVSVVQALHAELSTVGPPFSLALIENGSRDGTRALLHGLADQLQGCHVVELDENAGYGGGIRAGLATLSDPILGWHWGDGQVAPRVVREAWRLMLLRPFQMVKASRVERRDGSSRRRVSKLYAWACRSWLALESPDVNGCPKLFRRPLLESLDLQSNDWLLDLEAICKVEARDLRIGCVDAVMLPRPGGTSKVCWSTVIEFSRAIAAMRLTGDRWRD